MRRTALPAGAGLLLLVLSFLAGMIAFDKQTIAWAAYMHVKNAIIPYGPAHNDMFKVRASLFQDLDANAKYAMVGDSLTDLGEWQELLHRDDVVNRGITNDTTAGLLSRLKESAPDHSKVFLLIGVNDLLHDASVSATEEGIAKAVSRLQPAHEVLLQSTLLTDRDDALNRKIGQLDAFERNLCRGGGCTFVDLNLALSAGGRLNPAYTADGLHLNGSGYRRWAKVIAPNFS